MFPGNDQTSRTLSKKPKDLTNKDKGRGTSTPQPCILCFFVWGVVNNVNQVLLGRESIPCKKLIRKDLSLLGEAGHLCMCPRHRNSQQPPYHLQFFFFLLWADNLCVCGNPQKCLKTCYLNWKAVLMLNDRTNVDISGLEKTFVSPTAQCRMTSWSCTKRSMTACWSVYSRRSSSVYWHADTKREHKKNYLSNLAPRRLKYLWSTVAKAWFFNE